MPYLLRNDDLLIAAFLLSFLLIVWAVSRSWVFLEGWWTGFFNDEGKRKKFTKHLEVQLNGVVPIIVSVSLLLGVLLASYVQREVPELFQFWKPQEVYLWGCGALLGFILLKQLLYLLVNYTFFSASSTAEWARSYLVTLLVEGVMLFPLVVATLFLDLSSVWQQIWFWSIVGLVELLRLLKLKVIFFHGVLGYVHIFLYFCTLNLATTYVAWQQLTHIKLLLDLVK